MENFLMIVEDELARQKELLRRSEGICNRSPEGLLRCRDRKKGRAFYIYGTGDAPTIEKNITDNASLLRKMVKKRMAKETVTSARENIRYLEKLRQHYQRNEPEFVLNNLPEAYRQASKAVGYDIAQRHAALQTKQFGFDPKIHIHETISGIRVRSKSEVIIANALTSHQIPFLYEKPFPYPADNGMRYSPDFTFELPLGDMYIWEHLGLLNDLSYCQHNAQKLHLYQKHGFMIGRNLLITQDDVHGGCDSQFIDALIRRHLLPHFR